MQRLNVHSNALHLEPVIPELLYQGVLEVEGIGNEPVQIDRFPMPEKQRDGRSASQIKVVFPKDSAKVPQEIPLRRIQSLFHQL